MITFAFFTKKMKLTVVSCAVTGTSNRSKRIMDVLKKCEYATNNRSASVFTSRLIQNNYMSIISAEH